MHRITIKLEMKEWRVQEKVTAILTTLVVAKSAFRYTSNLNINLLFSGLTESALMDCLAEN